MTKSASASSTHREVLLSDDFSDDRAAGSVIGSYTRGGILRSGIDVEGVVCIDNGALRIEPLIEAGWRRAALVYSYQKRRNGLALCVFMLNGHNTAQAENLPEPFRDRMSRWLFGSASSRVRVRLFRFVIAGRWRRTVRQFNWWWRIRRESEPVPPLNENLAVGWFSEELPPNASTNGNAFVMHATGPECGELWTRVGQESLRVARGIQNVPIYYVVMLREEGAVYYVTSVPGAKGLADYPKLRPVALDPKSCETPVYPGIHQSVLGQIGFRLDTRVYGIRVADLTDFDSWYGSAHAADRLQRARDVYSLEAEIGGSWRIAHGDLCLSSAGMAAKGDALSLLEPKMPSGLIHAVCCLGTRANGCVALVFRYLDSRNFWRLRASCKETALEVQCDGKWETISLDRRLRLLENATHFLQVVDDGQTVAAYLNGQIVNDDWCHDTRLASATGVGVQYSECENDLVIHSFEAHPRSLRLPAVLDLGTSWLSPGTDVVVFDDFNEFESDLAGRCTTVGNRIWQKTIGAGRITLTGNRSAKIAATVADPAPGRTAYTIPWGFPEFADVEVEITPPGPGPNERGISGFILWQDAHNYIIVNTWVHESYAGSSISSFFTYDGFEDLYDAIWTNVGKRVTWGIPVKLRLLCDGQRYIVYTDDEPVLFRSLRDVYPNYGRLEINRVGILGNWEWGTDTGSVFRNFFGRIQG